MPKKHEPVTGYAYVNDSGEINIKTVSPTELAAKVNAIVVESGGAVVPLDWWGSDVIDSVLAQVTRGLGKITKVSISLLDE